MLSQWIEFEGKQIFYVDLSGFKTDDRALQARLKETINVAGKGMDGMPEHSVLLLVDLRDTHITRGVQRIIGERIDATRQYLRKTAVVGLEGLRGIFLDYFGRAAGADTRGFDDPEAAKEWLVR